MDTMKVETLTPPSFPLFWRVELNPIILIPDLSEVVTKHIHVTNAPQAHSLELAVLDAQIVYLAHHPGYLSLPKM